MIKNLPAMQKTWVQSLGREDPLEEDMATHSSILAWRIPMDRGTQQTPLLPIKCAIALGLKNNVHNNFIILCCEKCYHLSLQSLVIFL